MHYVLLHKRHQVSRYRQNSYCTKTLFVTIYEKNELDHNLLVNKVRHLQQMNTKRIILTLSLMAKDIDS